jgi:nucleoside-diphosphate-sugar epimerase
MAQLPNSPTVLVTGSSGHLGCALVLALPAYGLTPLGIDAIPSDTTHIICDIANPQAVACVFDDNPSLRYIIHTATLHKPHVVSHTKHAFVETNIAGTLHLLEAAARRQPAIESLVFISTTSTFGSALSPKKGMPAAWITESVVPVPKNIYGATKVAAEDMCFLVHEDSALPVLVLRTSRFFPEADDDEDRRSAMGDENLKVCELTYRRVDIADVVQACVCAVKKAKEIGFAKYIISAPSPFANDAETLRKLDTDAGSVLRDTSPRSEAVFQEKQWTYLNRIDRVYDSSKAIKELGWAPEYTFDRTVERLANGHEWRSELTFKVGKRGYHAVPTGVYTLE